MLGLVELCARNLSAAIRDALNAQVAGKAANEATRRVDGHPSVPQSAIDKINEARLLLEIAQQELNSPPRTEVKGRCEGCDEPVPPGFYTCDGNGSHPSIANLSSDVPKT
jgi:hypothetical protein